MPSRPLVELRDVDVTADGRALLRRLTIDIAEGRILAIVCERADTRRALVGVLSGEIDGYQVGGDLVLDGRELVGRVASQGGTQAQLHVASVDGPADDRARVRELASPDLLELVGLTASESRVSSLDLPERLRAAYARALARQPRLLVVDLPHRGDAATPYPVHSAVLQRLARREQTVVVVTDSLAVAADVADDVLVTLDGAPVEHGSVYDICLRPAMPYVQDLLRVTPGPHRAMPDYAGFVDFSRREGCPWVLNCRAAVVRACSQEVPALRPVAPGHWAACHLLGGGA